MKTRTARHWLICLFLTFCSAAILSTVGLTSHPVDAEASEHTDAGSTRFATINSVFITNYQQAKRSASSPVVPRMEYGHIPLHFEPNVGQMDDSVKFFSRARNYEMFLTDSGAILRLPEQSKLTGKSPSKFFGMKIVGANAGTEVNGESELAGKTNYLIGNDRSNWKTGVPNYGKIRYSRVYDGIDAIFYGDQEHLEYDFLVQPHASPDQISVEFTGVERVRISEVGDLVLTSGATGFRLKKPFAYQEIDSEQREVEVSYIVRNSLTGAKQIGFQIGDYDRELPLVIDPVLSYSSYLGGDSETIGNGIAVDSNGNAYVAGQTTSTTGFPLVSPYVSQNPGGNAAFVTKINATGTGFVYSTYLTGPTPGPSAAYSIAVDTSGHAYVAGISSSCNFPTTAGSFLPVVPNCGGNFKGFVVKLNPSGSNLSYGTYLSSPDFLFTGELTGIALDSSNNAYITGWTQTPSFPTTPGAFKRMLVPNTQNAFVSKLNSSGSALIYSTFVGVNTPVPNTDPFDRANAIAVDSSGIAYITGQSVSQNFPVTNTAFQTFPGSRQDAFVTKLNANGTGLIYSTYLGGNGDEIGRAIAVDATGNAYVTGFFDGTNGFPFTPNAFRNGAGENCCASVLNGFLTKINPTGTALVYSTSLGTERQAMSGTGVAVDSTGSAYVVGGQGINAAYTVNAIQPVSQNNDAFVLKMNPAGTALTYSTNLGGINGNSIGSALAIDPSGSAYVTGLTTASNFLITPGAAQSTKPGGQSSSSFITKIATSPTDCPAITINPQPLATAVLGQNYNQQLTASGGVGPYTFVQAPGFGANNLPSGLTLAASGLISGLPANMNFGFYIVTVQAVDANGCVGIRTFNLPYVQRIPPLQVSVTGRTAILRGRPNRYIIEYTNNGDADVFDIPLYVRLPDFLTVNSADQSIERPNVGQAVPCVTLPRIRARSTGAIPLIVTVPNQPEFVNARFRVEARLGYAFPSSSSSCGTTNNRTQNDGGVNTEVVGAFDPNDKIGPSGAGAARFINTEKPLDYIINFENIATATAPAQTIVVTDQLDVSKYDLTTFAFGETTIGNLSFAPQNNRTSFFRDFDLRPANNIIARIEANLDTTSGLLTWRLRSIDPSTGLPTDDPLAGILPPNTVSPRGQGSVSFRVRLKPNVATGSQITNQARIVFDLNAPIDTPVWSNTLDLSNPTSTVQTLPASVPPSFTVSWAGTDSGSGIDRYTVFVSDNGGPYTPFLTDTTAMSGAFAGQIGHTYGFYSIATDAAGNREPAKTSAETTTTANIPQLTISGRVFTPSGIVIRNARVTLTDSNGVGRSVTTSSFGTYLLADVALGQTYTLGVSTKRYRFAPRILQVTSSLTDVDFMGLE